jgi:EAL domain-containing protein (putative c-di-GMP-specific phosphodiesterase class I)
VIRLARGLNLVTIAEGIETVAQRDALAALGCDIMQGYLLAKPMPMGSLMPWLAEHPC